MAETLEVKNQPMNQTKATHVSCNLSHEEGERYLDDL